MTRSTYLELLDWRRRVAELFGELRQRPPDAATLAWFRHEKDILFREHPQSPIPADQRDQFRGLRYWPFDPEARVSARFAPTDSDESALDEFRDGQRASPGCAAALGSRRRSRSP